MCDVYLYHPIAGYDNSRSNCSKDGRTQAIMSTYRDFPLSADTSPDVEKQLFELLQKKTPEEKLRMVSKMTATTRALAMTGLRARFPAESEDELELRLVELLYGSELALKVKQNRRKKISE